MCQAFAENGHEVVLIYPKIKDKIENNIDDIYEFYGVKKNFKLREFNHPNSIVGSIIYLTNIFFFLIQNRKFDIVYGRYHYGCFLGSLLNQKVIFEAHKPFDHDNLAFFLLKKILKNNGFKKIIVISKSLKDIYLKNFNIKPELITVAHDGADEISNFDSKIELLGNKDKLKVGYVGHLYEGRGIDLIIECAKKINDMTFHIVGGTDEDLKYWKNYISKLKLNNIFFYGFVPPKETIPYKNSFDILLAPYSNKVSISGSGSSSDTSKFMSPLKIFEYMAHKKPIIASDLPVLREVLNSKNSLLVQNDNIEIWVKAILLLKNKDHREILSSNALNDFRKYTWRARALFLLEDFKNYL